MVFILLLGSLRHLLYLLAEHARSLFLLRLSKRATSTKECFTCLSLVLTELLKLVRGTCRTSDCAETCLMLRGLLWAMDLDSVSVGVGVSYELEYIIVVLITLTSQLHNSLVISNYPGVLQHFSNGKPLSWLAY